MLKKMLLFITNKIMKSDLCMYFTKLGGHVSNCAPGSATPACTIYVPPSIPGYTNERNIDY